MKKSAIQISFPTEKLEAVQYYSAEKGGNITAEMEDALQKLYERIVPKEVRAYLEVKEQTKPASRPRPPRSDSPPPPLAGEENSQQSV